MPALELECNEILHLHHCDCTFLKEQRVIQLLRFLIYELYGKRKRWNDEYYILQYKIK
jgi:hypothetical protein